MSEPRQALDSWERDGHALARQQTLPTCEWLSKGHNLRDYIAEVTRKYGGPVFLPAGRIVLERGDQFPRWSDDRQTDLPQGIKVVGAGSQHAPAQGTGWSRPEKTLTSSTVIVLENSAEPVFRIRGMRNVIADLTIVGGGRHYERLGGMGVYMDEQPGWACNENKLENVSLGGFLFPILEGREGSTNGSDNTFEGVAVDNCLTGLTTNNNQTVNTDWLGGSRAYMSRVDVPFWGRRGGRIYCPHFAGKQNRVLARIDGGGPNTSPHFVCEIAYLDNGPKAERPVFVDASRAIDVVHADLGWVNDVSNADASGHTYLFPPRDPRYARKSCLSIREHERVTLPRRAKLNVDRRGWATHTTADAPEVGRWIDKGAADPVWVDIEELLAEVLDRHLPKIAPAPADAGGE